MESCRILWERKSDDVTRGKEAAGELADRKSSSWFCCDPLSLNHYEKKELCLCTPLVLALWFCERGH